MRLTFAQAAWINLGLAAIEAVAGLYDFAFALGLLAVTLFGVYWHIERRRRAKRRDETWKFYY